MSAPTSNSGGVKLETGATESATTVTDATAAKMSTTAVSTAAPATSEAPPQLPKIEESTTPAATTESTSAPTTSSEPAATSTPAPTASTTAENTPATTTPTSTAESTPTSTAPTADAQTLQKLQSQVEFYFSNSNLPRDKFLKGLYDQDQGYVPLSVIASFKRVQELSTNIADLQAAIEQSKQIKLSSDRSRLTRVHPLPQNLQPNKQTVHISGLPTDDNLTTIDTVSEYFKQLPIVKQGVAAVRLHRQRVAGGKQKNDSESKKSPLDGTAFVEFNTPEDAQAVAQSTDLNFKVLPSTLTNKSHSDDTSETTTTDSILSSTHPLKAMMKADYHAQFNDSSDKSNKRKGAPAVDAEQPFPADRLIKISNLNAEASSRESIKEFITTNVADSDIAYIEFQRGDTEGIVRLNESDASGAKALVEKLTAKGDLKVDGKEPALSALAGDDEKEAWRRIRQSQADRKAPKPRGGDRGGKRQRR